MDRAAIRRAGPPRDRPRATTITPPPIPTSPSRLFFQIDPELARAIIELVAIRLEEVSDSAQAITPEQRVAIEEVKGERAARLTLDRLGLKVGDELTFAKDPAVTATVASPKSLMFRGQEQSLSAAALIVIREMGYNWTAVRGADFWLRNGVKLSATALMADEA